MPLHHIYRNGVKYDTLNTETHAVIQICRSYAHDDLGVEYDARDETGEIYYSCSVPPFSTPEKADT